MMRARPSPPRTVVKPSTPLWAMVISSVAVMTGILTLIFFLINKVPREAPSPANVVEGPSNRDGVTTAANLSAPQDPVRASVPAVTMQKENTFRCKVVRVHDGDGPLWCEEGPRVRLAGVAARELDGTCLPGHPCPEASAAAAQKALQNLALGQALSCEQVGTSYDRIVAWCQTSAGADLSCAMVRSGTALRWPKYDEDGRLDRCQ